jgi:dCMP deaminase
MAAELAKRSLCVRDQVGAVVVDKHNKIIGEGYNGPPRGFWHGGEPCTKWCKRVMMAQAGTKHGLALDYTDCPSLHAEANALLQADRSLCLNGTIFVTSHVCMGCAKLIANSGLGMLVVRSTVKDHRRSDEVYDFLRACKIELSIWEDK